MSKRHFACGVIAAMLLILPAPASGQEIGVKAGVNFASLTPEEDEEPDISRRVGAVGGVWVRTPPTARFSFQKRTGKATMNRARPNSTLLMEPMRRENHD